MQLLTKLMMSQLLLCGFFKQHDHILSKIKSKYWERTHKCGITIAKMVAQVQAIDKENSDTLWWDSIVMEMKNVRPAFEW
jgi:hypothetical protein